MDKMLEVFRFRYNGPELKASGLLEIDPESLRLGGVLYFGVKDEPPEDKNEFKSGYDHTFTTVSPKDFEGSVKLRISWIAWQSKVVILIRRYEADAEELFKQLKGVCNLTEFKDRLDKLKELPDDWTPSTEDISRHPIGLIQSLIGRLNVVEELQSEKLDWHFPVAKTGLALFVLCTCIESLSRTDQFIPYKDWLKAKKTEGEVEEAISKTPSKGSPKSLLADVYESYLDRYGIQKAYRDFLHKYLDKNWRNKLAGTITVLKNRPPHFQVEQTRYSLKNFIKYLVDFRHKFAHGLESHYNLPTKAEIRDLMGERYTHSSFFTYQKVHRSGAFETVITKNLLETLTQAIRIALWNWILERYTISAT